MNAYRCEAKLSEQYGRSLNVQKQSDLFRTNPSHEFQYNFPIYATVEYREEIELVSLPYGATA